ncbi:MAG: hypothetical protein ACE5GS_11270 [Kiloniellaceae bacterium]
MAEIAYTPSAFVSDTLETARTGLTPAIVGVAGAMMGLYVLTPFLAPASVPMSVLGIVFGRRSENLAAVALGALGVSFAISALLRSDAFWLAFAAVFGGVGAP